MTDYRLWPSTSGPAGSSADGAATNLGIEFTVSATSWATQLHFWRADTSIVAPLTGCLWRVNSAAAGTLLASETYTLSGTGWQTVTLTTPIALSTSETYRVGYHVPAGSNYSATSLYFSTGPGASGITNGIITAPNGATAVGADQGSYVYAAAGGFPINSFNSTCYWGDVTVTDVNPAGPQSEGSTHQSALAMMFNYGRLD